MSPTGLAFYKNQAKGLRMVIADCDHAGGVSRFYRAALLEAEAEAWDCARAHTINAMNQHSFKLRAGIARKRAKMLREYAKEPE